MGGVILLWPGLTKLAADRAINPPARVEDTANTNHPVHIRRSVETPRIATGETDMHGRPITVACSTCHSSTRPNPALRDAQLLREFHQGMTFSHGTISCLSCHNATDYDTLRLADGSSVAFENTMQLCAQCHGPQARDYRNGSHGGMSGHWDLKRGARFRNHCLDCHDPHAPQYPLVMPVFPPVPVERKH